MKICLQNFHKTFVDVQLEVLYIKVIQIINYLKLPNISTAPKENIFNIVCCSDSWIYINFQFWCF